VGPAPDPLHYRKSKSNASSPILVTLMKEALSSSETSVLTRATRLNIPEDAILYNQMVGDPYDEGTLQQNCWEQSVWGVKLHGTVRFLFRPCNNLRL
jgi:hypothetical protein